MNVQDPGTLTGLVEAVVVLLTGYRLVSRAPSIGERVVPRSEHPRLFWAFTLMNLALGLLLLSSILLIVLPTPLGMDPFGFLLQRPPAVDDDPLRVEHRCLRAGDR